MTTTGYRRELWRRGMKPVIARRSTDHGSGLGRVRWMVERTFAWLHNFRRLRIRWERDAGLHYALLSLGCSRDLLVPHPIVRHGRGRCSYAFCDGEPGLVYVAASLDDGTLAIVISDDGHGGLKRSSQ
jgi:prepilin-type processing-associated H-X9-DG protein